MKICWISFGNVVRTPDGRLTSDVASLRYRLLSRLQHATPGRHQNSILRLTGPASDELRTRAMASDVLVFVKSFTPANEELAREALSAGLKVVWDVCDDHYEHPEHGAHYRAMTSLATLVVCNTPEMAEVAGRYSAAPPVVLEDPYEGPAGTPSFAPGETLRLLWFGHPSNLDGLHAALPELHAFADEHPASLVVLTQPGEAAAALCRHAPAANLTVTLKPWSLDAQWQELADCDVVLLPSSDKPGKLVKSANRMIEALRAGRPAVAHPLPAYEAFSAFTPVGPSLAEGLKSLLREPAAVERRVGEAQAQIEGRFSPALISERWERLIEPLTRTPASPLGSTSPVRLNLGCGDKILPGYVNVDVAEARLGKKPDVLCDLHALTPFEDNSADEIMAIHVVEHFWRWEVVDVLKEWVRVLKPGGRMILECPNLISACEALLADPDQAALPGPEGQRSMWVFYGDPRWKDPLMVHRWGYTPKTLAQVMHQAGLRDLRQEPAQFKLREPRDMRVTGVKPK